MKKTLLAVCTLAATLTGCASTPVVPAATPESPTTPTGLMLSVKDVGGYTTPNYLAARIPTLSVYADGRVITEGPVAAIYPGPALPNLEEYRIDPAKVTDLVNAAAAAGIKSTTDFGSPPVADVPNTRVTVYGPGGQMVAEAAALRGFEDLEGDLTAAQREARKKLRDYITSIEETTTALTPKPYTATSVAVLASPAIRETDPEAAPASNASIDWPGTTLPGTALNEELGVYCALTEGAEATAVLKAAKSATAETVWTSDGKQWSVLFRPLLPDEMSCAALQQ